VDEPVDHRRGDAAAEHLAPRAEGLLLVAIPPPRFATEESVWLIERPWKGLLRRPLTSGIEEDE
jgi:hypothetical protein